MTLILEPPPKTLPLTDGSLACPPRFGTPRNPGRRTLGGDAAVIAMRLHRPLMPWQQYVADVALELDDDGNLFYSEINLVVGRQEGKTELKFIICVLRLTAMAHKLGPQRVTYTMQNRKKARARLERDYAMRLRNGTGFKEIDSKSRERPKNLTDWRLGMNSGVEAIQFGRDSYLQIDTPSREDGHGDSLDLGMIDEAFAHEDSTVELGMGPAMITRESSQLWVLSAAGDLRSKYLWRKIIRGRKIVEGGLGEETRVAVFEWSGEFGVDDPGDPATWWRCCPALGYTIEETKLAALWAKAAEEGPTAIADFCRSYLCMWPEVPVLDDAATKGGIDMKAWLALADAFAERGSNVVFGVDISSDRLTHVAVAWRRPDGLVQVQLADTGLSPLRTPDRLNNLVEDWKGEVMLGGTSAALESEVSGATVLSAAQFAAGCGRLEDYVNGAELRHGNQPELNAAVDAAEWRSYGTAGEQVLQLRDAPVVGPLAAVVRALAGLVVGATPAPAKPLVEKRSSSRDPLERDIATMQF